MAKTRMQSNAANVLSARNDGVVHNAAELTVIVLENMDETRDGQIVLPSWEQ